MEKTFNPADIEQSLYQSWEEQGYFSPTEEGDGYCIAIPPPNVTGSLHMGHALNHTLQDVLIRYNRLKGKDALWQPGTDHAGIATQMVVERKLDKEGTSRHDLGRDGFLEESREREQALFIFLPGMGADGGGAFGADINEILLRPGDRAFVQRQSETQFRKQQQFVAYQRHRPSLRRWGTADRVEQGGQSDMQSGIAMFFGQDRSGQRGYPIQCCTGERFAEIRPAALLEFCRHRGQLVLCPRAIVGLYDVGWN